MATARAIILEYGKRPPARWRRLVRWTVVAVLLVTLAFAGLFALRNLSIWVARRHGYAAVTAWYEQARTTVIPAGTLLYSERPEDFDPHVRHGRNIDGTPRDFVSFNEAQPTLRHIAYYANGVPLASFGDELYVHGHPQWAVTGGSRPSLFCVTYRGLDAQGRPEFISMCYERVDSSRGPRFASMGSTTTVQSQPGRSLANLRIFAGVPHPTDATRFALPFDCEGGRGRFEFQTDVDVTDGGKLAPDVSIEWDAAATQPGAADAVSR